MATFSVEIDAKDLFKIRRRLRKYEARAPQASADATNFLARALWFGVTSAASGRPGPQVITGAYRNSIRITKEATPGDSSAIVSTNAPQAARLEYGFVGVDSLGRHYAQPPYPHWIVGYVFMATQVPEARKVFERSLQSGPPG